LATEKYIVLALAVDFGLHLSYSELREVLAKLEEAKHVHSIRRDDAELLWSATGLGKSVIAEIRLG
jgi:hypothetical protein